MHSIVILCLISSAYSFQYDFMGNQLFGPLAISKRIISRAAGNTSCSRDLRELVTDMYQRKLWALEMIDANGKINPGLLAGNTFQMGHYDECLRINHTTAKGHVIRGQYCSAMITLKQNATSQFSFLFDFQNLLEYLGLDKFVERSNVVKEYHIIYGTCFPTSCSVDILQSIWDYLELFYDLSVHVIFNDTLCRYEGKPLEPYQGDPYVVAFFILIGLVVLISTVYDYVLQSSDKKCDDDILTIFSLYSNFKSLVSTKTNDTSLTCLDGIKVLSMFWVLLGHRFLANVVSPNINSFSLLHWRRRIENSFISAAPMAVDTFFTMSGLLLCYTKLKYTENKKLSWSWFYLFRWIRLTPALLAVVLFYISILKNLGDGPFWSFLASKATKSCYHTWWATLLYFSNSVDFKYQCVEHSWYLAVDTQLYIISPIILGNISKYPKQTLLGMILTGTASCLYVFIMSMRHNYGSIVFDMKKEYFPAVYLPTYARISPWLIGIYFGYFIYKAKMGTIKMNQTVISYSWPLSLATLFGIVLYHVNFASNADPIDSALFNALSKPLWSIAMCGIIVACVTGQAVTINKFLSIPVFRILSKMSYSIYLIHVVIIFVVSAGQKTTKEFTNLANYHEFCGDLIFILISSGIFCLIFESPVLALMKILEKRRERNISKSAEMEITRIQDPILHKDYQFWIFALRPKKTE